MPQSVVVVPREKLIGIAGWEKPFRQLVALDRQPDLLHVIRAGATPSRFARALNCREQERHQHADDRDHDKQLD
jgi:hypothetical protein